MSLLVKKKCCCMKPYLYTGRTHVRAYPFPVSQDLYAQETTNIWTRVMRTHSDGTLFTAGYGGTALSRTNRVLSKHSPDLSTSLYKDDAYVYGNLSALTLDEEHGLVWGAGQSPDGGVIRSYRMADLGIEDTYLFPALSTTEIHALCYVPGLGVLAVGLKLVTGYLDYASVLFCIDANGNVLWSVPLEFINTHVGDWVYFSNMAYNLTSDGTYCYLGTITNRDTRSGADYLATIWKVDLAGNVVDTFRPTSEPSEFWYSVHVSADGSRLWVGGSINDGQGSYASVYCLNSSGGVIWSWTSTRAGSQVTGVIPLTDGSCWVQGTSLNSSGSVVAKFTNTGSVSFPTGIAIPFCVSQTVEA